MSSDAWGPAGQPFHPVPDDHATIAPPDGHQGLSPLLVSITDAHLLNSRQRTLLDTPQTEGSRPRSI